MGSHWPKQFALYAHTGPQNPEDFWGCPPLPIHVSERHIATTVCRLAQLLASPSSRTGFARRCLGRPLARSLWGADSQRAACSPLALSGRARGDPARRPACGSGAPRGVPSCFRPPPCVARASRVACKRQDTRARIMARDARGSSFTRHAGARLLPPSYNASPVACVAPAMASHGVIHGPRLARRRYGRAPLPQESEVCVRARDLMRLGTPRPLRCTRPRALCNFQINVATRVGDT